MVSSNGVAHERAAIDKYVNKQYDDMIKAIKAPIIKHVDYLFLASKGQTFGAPMLRYSSMNGNDLESKINLNVNYSSTNANYNFKPNVSSTIYSGNNQTSTPIYLENKVSTNYGSKSLYQ